MMQDKVVNNLINAGLTASEARVYYFLLKKKDSTASEIASLASVHRSKIYDVLTQLVNKGLCTETLGKVRKYSPANPKVAFDNLHEELELKKKYLNDLSDILSPIYNSAQGTTDPLDYIKVLRDKKITINTFEQLQQDANKEILCFNKKPYVMDFPKRGNKFKRYKGYDSIKRGIVHKSINESQELEIEFFFKSAEFFGQAGEETRVLTTLSLPFKMCVIDEKIVMLNLENKLTEDMSITTLFIEHPDLAKGFKMVFNLYWRNAISFEEFKQQQENKNKIITEGDNSCETKE